MQFNANIRLVGLYIQKKNQIGRLIRLLYYFIFMTETYRRLTRISS